MFTLDTAPAWMTEADKAREELAFQKKLATQRLKFLETEQENVRHQARQFLGQAQQFVEAELQSRYAGDPGIVQQPPSGFGIDPGLTQPPPASFGGDPGILRQPPGLTRLPGGTLQPSIPEPSYAPSAGGQQGRFPIPEGPNPNPLQYLVQTHTAQGERDVRRFEAEENRRYGLIPPAEVQGPVQPAEALRYTPKLEQMYQPDRHRYALTPQMSPLAAPQSQQQAIAQRFAERDAQAQQVLRAHGLDPMTGRSAATQGGSQPGGIPAIRGDARTPGQQQAVQIAGMSQAQQAQQAASQAGVQINPRTLKQLRSPLFWVREGAKAEINALLGYEKLQVDREGVQIKRQELDLKRQELEQEQRAAQQLQEQIDAATQFQQGQAQPGAGGQPQAAAPQDRMRTLEAQRARLEEQRRRLLPFSRMEQGKRAYDAVGSQLDDVNQQIKYIQDEAQEERRFQQSERRLQISEDRAARVESRAADAAMRSARALELQGESAARAARTGNINAESTLRGDFQQDTKDYRQVRDAWGKVVTSAKEPSAAGDLSLIFGYMKLLDPTSVVREGEFATAQNAAGVPERIIAQYNKLLSGERLSPATRTDFVDRAKKLYGQYTKDYQGVRTQYRGIAERQGLNPDNVTLDYESTAPEPPATEPAPAGPPNDPLGIR
jgi:hypothetical protein